MSLSFFQLLILAAFILNFNLAQVQNKTAVFSKGEAGYYCIKIPTLLNVNGDLLAWGEARHGSCSDYAPTDLVMKRSKDNGLTWSPLEVLFAEPYTVTGNAAPVYLPSQKKIVFPYCKNNSLIFVSESYDFGYTWVTPREITNDAKRSDWGWVGTGPPASIQLQSGRIIIPAYHAYFHKFDGLITQGYIIYSDDFGSTFQIGAQNDHTLFLPNENQIVQLSDGKLLSNARILLPFRIFGYSQDNGMTFSDYKFRWDLVGSLGGCEGSTIIHPLNNWLFFSNPCNWNPLRLNMCIHISKDSGETWEVNKIIDPARSAYSALAILNDQSVGILYERADKSPFIFEPQEIVFIVAWQPTTQQIQ